MSEPKVLHEWTDDTEPYSKTVVSPRTGRKFKLARGRGAPYFALLLPDSDRLLYLDADDLADIHSLIGDWMAGGRCGAKADLP